MMGGMEQGFGFGMGFGWIIPIVILGLVILGVVYLIRSASSRDSASGGKSEGNALAILKEQYARGELDADTFETMRRKLE